MTEREAALSAQLNTAHSALHLMLEFVGTGTAAKLEQQFALLKETISGLLDLVNDMENHSAVIEARKVLANKESADA